MVLRTATMLLAAVVSVAGSVGGAARQEPPRPAGPAPLVLDVAWLDASGHPVAGPPPEALEVRVDGRVRRVISIRPSPSSTRLVLLAIDEGSFAASLEKNVRALAGRIVAALGPDARVALLTLPVASPRIAFTNDRAALSAAIDQVAGKGSADVQVAGEQEAGARPPVDRQTADRDGRERPDNPDSQAPRDQAASPAASLAPLQRVLANLRNTPGPKTVLLLTAGGNVKSGGPEVADALRPLVSAAIASRSAVDIVQLPAVGGTTRAAWLDDLASFTGGIVVDGRRDAEAAGRVLSDKLAASYVVELEADAADRDGRAHAVAVTAAAKGRVFCPSRLPGGDAAAVTPASPATTAASPAPPPAAAPASPAAGSVAVPIPGAPPAPRAARPRDAEADALLARAGDYLAEYQKALSSVVAEEDYIQHHNRVLSFIAPGKLGASGGQGVDYSVRERHLKSDFLLVQSPDVRGWVPFRDVFEVDGKAVRDRQDRLRRLFLDAPATAFDQARRIMSESARYNLGEVPRTINTPTLPLMLADPRHRQRFSWKRQGEQTVEGVRARRVEFEEQEHPTLIRTSRGDDVAIVGTLWIDPETGRIVKGTVTAGLLWIDPTTGRVLRESVSRRVVRGGVVEVTVLFKQNASLDLWVPAEMKEFYQYPDQTIDATATYSNFRRFQVKTEETIKVPK